MNSKVFERILIILMEILAILDIVLYLLILIRPMLNWPFLNHLNIYAIQSIRADTQVFIYIALVAIRLYKNIKNAKSDKEKPDKNDTMNINKL